MPITIIYHKAMTVFWRTPNWLAAVKAPRFTFSTDGLQGKDLTYFCSFPGHWTVMKGKFTIE
ncbi:hypothetical protein [Salinivibrio socompensis]|uniref:hypothetical protein n=1 Tax=Salinivibrio socompensis TaxID=1510206 RepID=UPI003B8359C8